MSFNSASYTYDSNGVRLSKTVNDVLHSYFINGTTIFSEKVGNDVYTYLYDATGIAGIRHNDKYYYFLKTQQGDIKYIVDGDGILQAEYVYDAWGNCQILVNGVDITDNSEYNTHIAKVNPFRYRGYYFDTETGLYYLNSRYYDPQTRRFVNADDPSIPVLEQATDIGGLNLYSYCYNNPIMFGDPSGYVIDTVFDIISFLFSVVEVIANPADFTAWLGLAGDAVDLATPFLTGVGETVRALRTSNKIVGAADNTIDSYRHLKKVYKRSGLEIHHILEKRFVDYLLGQKVSLSEINRIKNNLLSIPLTKSQHRIYTKKWRDVIGYQRRGKDIIIDAKVILMNATDVYKNDPKLLGVVIYSLAELVQYK